jgi:hypothetical protein
MSILRVVQDEVEFVNVIQTGVGAISESGIGRICGVSHKSIEPWAERVSVGTCSLPKCLEPLRGKPIELELRGEKNSRLFLAPFCAGMIEYYAFESPRKTKEALFAYRKFAQMGIERWIQSITGWQPPTPANPKQIDLTDIRLPIDAINILTAENFSSTVYSHPI